MTDDLFDGYRNLYLALESILSSMVPWGRLLNGRWEREGVWLRRALQHADTLLPLGPFASSGPPDPVEAV